jgi:hypothetical protein
MQELTDVLDRERRLLEMVLFKLVEARHLLAADEARFLPWASAELERAVERVREATLLRAVIAQRVAAGNGLAADAGLRTLITAADEPYAAILSEQAHALHRLSDEIRDEVARAGTLAERQLRGIDAVLAAVSELHEATVE